MVRHMPALGREEAAWAKTGKIPMAGHGADHPLGTATQRWTIQMRRWAGLPQRRGWAWYAGWHCPHPVPVPARPPRAACGYEACRRARPLPSEPLVA